MTCGIALIIVSPAGGLSCTYNYKFLIVFRLLLEFFPLLFQHFFGILHQLNIRCIWRLMMKICSIQALYITLAENHYQILKYQNSEIKFEKKTGKNLVEDSKKTHGSYMRKKNYTTSPWYCFRQAVSLWFIFGKTTIIKYSW